MARTQRPPRDPHCRNGRAERSRCPISAAERGLSAQGPRSRPRLRPQLVELRGFDLLEVPEILRLETCTSWTSLLACSMCVANCHALVEAREILRQPAQRVLDDMDLLARLPSLSTARAVLRTPSGSSVETDPDPAARGRRSRDGGHGSRQTPLLPYGITAPSEVTPGSRYFDAIASTCFLTSERKAFLEPSGGQGHRGAIEHPVIVLERKLQSTAT